MNRTAILSNNVYWLMKQTAILLNNTALKCSPKWRILSSKMTLSVIQNDTFYHWMTLSVIQKSDRLSTLPSRRLGPRRSCWPTASGGTPTPSCPTSWTTRTPRGQVGQRQGQLVHKFWKPILKAFFASPSSCLNPFHPDCKPIFSPDFLHFSLFFSNCNNV